MLPYRVGVPCRKGEGQDNSSERGELDSELKCLCLNDVTQQHGGESLGQTTVNVCTSMGFLLPQCLTYLGIADVCILQGI